MIRPSPAVRWRAQLAAAVADINALSDIARALEPLTLDRPELGRLAGPRCRDEPGYRWLSYKEAYSPDLVRSILDSWCTFDGPLLDPFAGSGTSIMVAIERDMPAIGAEMLAYPQWAANTMLAARDADPERLRDIVKGASQAGTKRSNVGCTDLHAAPAAVWALSDDVARELLAIRAELPRRGSSIEADLAHLALLATVEGVSASVKDGTSLRHRSRVREGRTTRPGRKGLQAGPGDVRDAFKSAGAVIVDDLPKLGSSEAFGQVLRADARHLPLANVSMGGAVFSPPYPNRYDYSAIYQLELAVGGFVDDPDQLRAVRKSLLRSHLEAPAPESAAFEDPAIVAVLQTVAAAAQASQADSGRTLRMLVGYFEDMTEVFKEVARVLQHGAPAACVVATQTYFGVAVPTDLMLASLAQRTGLTLESLWVLRRKRVAVQQRARGSVTSGGGRESVLLLRRPS